VTLSDSPTPCGPCKVPRYEFHATTSTSAAELAARIAAFDVVHEPLIVEAGPSAHLAAKAA